MTREKSMIGVLIDPELRRKFERTLIDEFGHVSGNISPVVERLIRDYVLEKREEKI